MYRYDPDLLPQGRFEEFEVPVPAGRDLWSVMDVLDYISCGRTRPSPITSTAPATTASAGGAFCR